MGAGSGEWGEGKITQRHEEILEDDGHVHYFDSGDHFMTVYMCLTFFNFLKVYILSICSSLYVNRISTKL